MEKATATLGDQLVTVRLEAFKKGLDERAIPSRRCQGVDRPGRGAGDRVGGRVRLSDGTGCRGGPADYSYASRDPYLMGFANEGITSTPEDQYAIGKNPALALFKDLYISRERPGAPDANLFGEMSGSPP